MISSTFPSTPLKAEKRKSRDSEKGGIFPRMHSGDSILKRRSTDFQPSLRATPLSKWLVKADSGPIAYIHLFSSVYFIPTVTLQGPAKFSQ